MFGLLRNHMVRLFKSKLHIPRLNKHVFCTSKLHDQLETCFKQYGENTAIIHNGKKIKYKELHDSIFKLSYMLSHEYNLHRGDRLMMISDIRFDSFQIPLACSKLGVAFVPINPSTLYLPKIHKIIEPNIIICESKYSHLLSQCNTNLKSNNIIISDENNIHEFVASNYSITQLSCHNTDDDTYEIMLTSGVTGIPKACLLTHSTVFNSLNVKELNLSMDKILITTPHFSSTSQVITLTALKQGVACIIPASLKTKLDMNELCSLCNLYDITGFILFEKELNQLLKYCIENDVKFETIKHLFFGGNFIPFSTLYSIWSKQLFPNAIFIHVYGAATSMLAMNRTQVGGTHVKIIDMDANFIAKIIGYNKHLMNTPLIF